MDFKDILFLAYRSAIWRLSFKGQKLQGIRGVSKERGEDSSATYGDGIDAISIHDSRMEDKEGVSQARGKHTQSEGETDTETYNEVGIPVFQGYK